MYSLRPSRAAVAKTPSFSYSASVKESERGYLLCCMEIAKPHKRNTLAAVLLLASLLFSYAWRLVAPLALPGIEVAPIPPTYAVVSMGLMMLGFCYFIWQGKRWAAGLFAVVFALEVILPALDYKALLAGFEQQPARTVPFLVSYALEGWALWLLFK